MPADLSGGSGLPATAKQGSNGSGTLHVFVAFDWGEQIRLEQVERQFPGSRHELTRRRRTPFGAFMPGLCGPWEN